MNLASIVPPPAAPATSTKAPAGSGNATGAAGFLAVLATKFAATASSGTPSSASGDTAGEDADGMVAQDLLTLAALASRTASAALPQAVPVTVPLEEGGAEGEIDAAQTTPEPATGAAASSGDAVIPSAGDLDARSALPGDVVPPSGDARPDVAAGDEPSPEATGALSDVATPVAEPVAPDTGAAVDEVRPVTTGRATTEEATTEQATTTTRSATGPVAGASAASDADDLTGQRPEPVAQASGRGRGRADEALTRTRLEGAGTVRTESLGAPTPVAPGSAASTVRIDAATPSAAAQRVLDLVTQLEDAPPPRVVVIDTGEIRVRLGLDAGTVRMTVLGPLGETGEELLREAADALEAGGFGTELDRGADGDERGGERATGEDRPATTTPSSSRRRAAPSRAGLQL